MLTPTPAATSALLPCPRPRILVVGAGHLGTYHLQKIAAHPEAQLVGVVDSDPGRLLCAQERHGIPGSAQLRDFVGQVDGCIIATPTSTHHAVALEAMDLGWHVLLEKPMAATVEEAIALVERAAERGTLLQVGHIERFNPAVSAALGVADRPRYIVAERLGPFSGRSTDVDVVLDLMIHDLDIVAALVDSPIQEIRAVGVPVMTHAVDMASARLVFADGTVAQLSAGRASMEPSRKLRLFTVERYVSVDCAKREVKSVRRLPAEDDGSWPQITGEMLDVPEGDALALQDHDFIESIQLARAPRVDGRAGLRAMQLAEAVKSAMTIPGPPL